jgi:hypothetical protein
MAANEILARSSHNGMRAGFGLAGRWGRFQIFSRHGTTTLEFFSPRLPIIGTSIKTRHLLSTSLREIMDF